MQSLQYYTYLSRGRSESVIELEPVPRIRLFKIVIIKPRSQAVSPPHVTKTV